MRETLLFKKEKRKKSRTDIGKWSDGAIWQDGKACEEGASLAR